MYEYSMTGIIEDMIDTDRHTAGVNSTLINCYINTVSTLYTSKRKYSNEQYYVFLRLDIVIALDISN